MKWWTTLLALYLLGLSLWPCADEMDSLPEQSSVAVLTSAASEPGTSHHEHDQCTPFCSCACCAVTITVIGCFSYVIKPVFQSIPASVTSFDYTLIHWADPLTAIWQPPKLRV
ncbi:DUF6660 family protein [Spirosoma endophyticum]|uniref:DUF6660 family protein n=1 Tax=Spirosoma endophyticum TaxID=662367 RepID=UPI000B81613E|nr:DUF6660 family protein [Spirosoma endophyticum]